MLKQLLATVAAAAMLIATAAVPLPTLGAAQARPVAKGCGDGKNRRVRILNATSYSIQRLYGSNVGARSWQEDVLGDAVLRPGNSVTVNWDDGSCYCEFDIKAVYSDGDTSVKSGIDVCRLETFRFVE